MGKTKLVSFGEYLLSPKRTKLIKDKNKHHPKTIIKEKLQNVYHADIENWKVLKDKT